MRVDTLAFSEKRTEHNLEALENTRQHLRYKVGKKQNKQKGKGYIPLDFVKRKFRCLETNVMDHMIVKGAKKRIKDIINQNKEERYF